MMLWRGELTWCWIRVSVGSGELASLAASLAGSLAASLAASLARSLAASLAGPLLHADVQKVLAI
jgi:hypothetical protein